MYFKNIISYGLCVFCVVGLAGCSMKAQPAPYAGFIAGGGLTENTNFPFHRVWVNKQKPLNVYRQIYIAPVNTEHLLAMSWWERLGRNKEKMFDEVEYLAVYTRVELQNAFQAELEHPMRVLSFPQEDTLVFEFAIVELVPNKAALEALSYAAGPFAQVIGAIGGNFVRASSRSSVAFEARMRDSNTGEIIARFADREGEKMSIVNLKNFTWYGHAKSIIKEWAEQFVQVVHKERWEYICDSETFELKPY